MLALGAGDVLGLYRSVLSPDVDPLRMTQWAGANLMVIAYAAGWIIVPGALVGLWLAIARPRSRAELAFVVLGTLVAAALVLEATLFGDVERVQERYVFYVVPLVATAFALYAARGWPHRLAHGALAASLLALSAAVPLAGYAAARGKEQSPFLRGVFRLEQLSGSPETGSLLVAALAALLALGAVAALPFRPHRAAAVALALAVGVGAAARPARSRSTCGARERSGTPSRPIPRGSMPRGLGSVSLVQGVGGLQGAAMEQLFWNRSLDRVLLLPGRLGSTRSPRDASSSAATAR